MAQAYKLYSEDFSQMGREQTVNTLLSWSNVMASVQFKWMKLIFRTVPVNLDEPLERIIKVEKKVKDKARQDHLQSYRYMMSNVAKEDLFTNEHYAVVPGKKDLADRIAMTLLGGMGIPIAPLDHLPQFVTGVYKEENTRYMIPHVKAGRISRRPLYTLLRSHEIEGQWTWNVLAELLYIGFPLDISVVINTPKSALEKLDMAEKKIIGVLKNVGGKTRIEQISSNLAGLKQEIIAGDNLHQVAVGILLQGRTKEEIDERLDKIKVATAGRIKFHTPVGNIARTTKNFFGLTEERPTKNTHNVPSKGVAWMVGGPLGVRRRGLTRGVLWGMTDATPLFWDGFGTGPNMANHGCILGKTGSGKTVSLNTITWREMDYRNTQVIMMEPLGHSYRLYDALGPARASYNPLRLESIRVNPVECIFDDIREQTAYLQFQIHMLLGRDLSNFEDAAIDRAARVIYDGIDPSTAPVNQPRLENLVRAMMRTSEVGEKLATEIDGMYVSSTLAENFNVPTEFDLKLEKDFIAFDFQEIPERHRTLLYYIVLNNVERQVRRKQRERPRLVTIDEFRYMSKDPILAKSVANMYKRFRTYWCGVWIAEQNPSSFTTDMEGNPNPAGLHILTNSTFIVSFMQKPDEAERLGKMFDLNMSQIQYLKQLTDKPMDKGRGLAILPDGVYRLKVRLSDYELAQLAGS